MEINRSTAKIQIGMKGHNQEGTYLKIDFFIIIIIILEYLYRIILQ